MTGALADNLDEAQRLVALCEPKDSNTAQRYLNVDVALEIAKVRCLIDIARTLRSVETWVNETGFGPR